MTLQSHPFFSVMQLICNFIKYYSLFIFELKMELRADSRPSSICLRLICRAQFTQFPLIKIKLLFSIKIIL